MKPLHKNTRKFYKEFQLGDWFFVVLLAEEPDVKLLDRTWATDRNGIRTEKFFSLEKLTNLDLEGVYYYRLIFGPLNISWSKLYD